jgi:ATP-dependent Lon protease
MNRLRTVFLWLFVLASFVAYGKGILPCMVYRHGLTNEQIDDILTRHPDAQLRITAQDWRAMRYQLHRFGNMTNYVEQIGGTNDTARVLLELHDRAETLATTNASLVKAVNYAVARYNVAAERANEYAEAYIASTNQYWHAMSDFQAELHQAVEERNEATNRAAIAEAKVARTEAFKAWLVEQRDNARLATTKALYQAIIDRLEGDEQ